MMAFIVYVLIILTLLIYNQIYFSFYREKVILDNRIKRLWTNNEAYYDKKLIKINRKGFKFLKIVIFAFSLL